MDRTVTDVLTEHQMLAHNVRRGGEIYSACSCGWRAPGGTDRPRHIAHQAATLAAAGLSRVLTDPERQAVERLRAGLIAQADARKPAADVYALDIARLVAVVERLAAAPAPEALVDAVARVMADRWGTGPDGWEEWRDDARAILAVVGQAPLPPEAYEAAEAWMRGQVAALEGGQAATHDTDTDCEGHSGGGLSAEEIRATADAQEPRTNPDGSINATHVAIEQTLRTRHGHPAYIAALDGPGKFRPAASRAAATDSGEGR